MGVECPKCNTDNPSDSKFCKECATPFPSLKKIITAPTKTLETPLKELTRGTTFAGRYEFIEELGRGGMGRVYKVFDKKIKEEVAIKILKPEIASDETIIERFSNELKLARKIVHKNVGRMYELMEDEGTHYITMEYVPGEDLKTFIRRAGQLTIKKAIFIAKQVCEGLAEAHKLGVVHRDLKPGNIMIDREGNTRVMDFGIARSLKAEGITSKGVVVGTLEYMSPEQVDGKEADQRSDIYSLGIILYEMLAGKIPFEGDSSLSIALRHKTDAPPDPKKVNPQISEDLKNVILKCMEKEKEKRYQKTKDILTDLSYIEKGIPISDKVLPKKKFPISKDAKSRIGLRRFFVSSLIFVLLAALTMIVFWPSREPVTAAESIIVLVADFQNQTGEGIFEGALEKTMSNVFEQESFISIYGRPKARKLVDQLDPSASGRLDGLWAQLVSRNVGINVLIDGSVEKSGEKYTLRVWALDPISSEKITESSKTIETRAEALMAADSLAEELRLGLHIHLFSTTSNEAMKAYTQAKKLGDLGKSEEALKEYLKALDHDPNFGRAYSEVAIIYLNSGRYEEGETYYQEALKRIDQMTDREKYITRGMYALWKRDYKKAIDEYSAVVKKYPSDPEGHSVLAITYFYARNMPKALEEARLDVKYNPQGVHAHNNLSWYALAAGFLQTAEEESRKALEIEPDFEKAHITLGLTLLAKDQFAKAAETYRKLQSLGSYGITLAAAGLADLAVYEGRLAEAVEILEEGIPFDLENKQGYDAAEKCIMLAHAYLLQEKKELASKVADRAVGIRNDAEIVFSAALVYLNAGQVEKARSLQAELFKKPQPEPRVYAKLIGGEMSRVKGDISNAVSLFHEAKDSIDTWIGHFFLGRAYLQAEDYSAANSEFENCLKRSGEAASVFLNDLPTYHYLPPVYYYLGRAQEGLKSLAASESYEKFLKIKQNADPGIPEVEVT